MSENFRAAWQKRLAAALLRPSTYGLGMFMMWHAGPGKTSLKVSNEDIMKEVRFTRVEQLNAAKKELAMSGLLHIELGRGTGSWNTYQLVIPDEDGAHRNPPENTMVKSGNGKIWDPKIGECKTPQNRGMHTLPLRTIPVVQGSAEEEAAPAASGSGQVQGNGPATCELRPATWSDEIAPDPKASKASPTEAPPHSPSPRQPAGEPRLFDAPEQPGVIVKGGSIHATIVSRYDGKVKTYVRVLTPGELRRHAESCGLSDREAHETAIAVFSQWIASGFAGGRHWEPHFTEEFKSRASFVHVQQVEVSTGAPFPGGSNAQTYVPQPRETWPPELQ